MITAQLAPGGAQNAGHAARQPALEFTFQIIHHLHQTRQIDACPHPHGLERLHGVLGRHVAGCPANKGAAAQAAGTDIEATDPGIVTGQLGGSGIFGVELFVSGDDIWFSEVSPRPHDTGMVTMITQYQNEFALHARAILGLPVDTSLNRPGASAVIYGGVEAEGVAFEDVDKALAEPGTQLRLFGKPGVSGQRRMGVVLARADDVDDARYKAVAGSRAVEVSL